jgi:allantoinase
MTVPTGEISSLPIMLELDDVNAMWDRKITVKNYAKMLIDAFDRMYLDGLDNGRLLVLNLHPWLIGQPFRIGYLEKALAHVRSKKGVWAATGSEIIEWYREQS